jgi:probable phosphoglycerate mutase
MVLELRKGLTLYFARHGETVANVEGRFQGHTIDTPLTERGLAQVRDVGLIMKREEPSLASFYRVASPLTRAQKSMQIILGVCGLPTDSYTTDPRIIEIDLGAWDGLTKTEARTVDPIAYDAREADKWNVKSLDSRENYSDVAARAESFVGDLTRNTLAVSHGAFTRILRGLFQGLTWKQMSDLDEPQGCVFRVRGSVVERLDV